MEEGREEGFERKVGWGGRVGERVREREGEADESFIKRKVKMMWRAYEVGLCHPS